MPENVMIVLLVPKATASGFFQFRVWPKFPDNSGQESSYSLLTPGGHKWQLSHRLSEALVSVSTGAVPKWHLTTWGWHGILDS